MEDPTGIYFKPCGTFYRRSTLSFVRRYRCGLCKSRPSDALVEGCYRQKKRTLNSTVTDLLGHVVSQREVARILKINYKTVVRKFRYQAFEAEHEFNFSNREKRLATVIEFDDLETFEHTKHKPLSVPIAVEGKTRRILSVDVALMPSRGTLAQKAREKYGKRPDLRQSVRKLLFERITELAVTHVEIRSDQNPSYPSIVKKYFPRSIHKRFRGRRGCVTGQGELKEGRFDPLFSINHTCAMFRANVNRLIRKTWCTTKSAERLRGHLFLYAHEHNRRLEEAERKRARKEPDRAG